MLIIVEFSVSLEFGNWYRGFYLLQNKNMDVHVLKFGFSTLFAEDICSELFFKRVIFFFSFLLLLLLFLSCFHFYFFGILRLYCTSFVPFEIRVLMWGFWCWIQMPRTMIRLMQCDLNTRSQSSGEGAKSTRGMFDCLSCLVHSLIPYQYSLKSFCRVNFLITMNLGTAVFNNNYPAVFEG